MLAPPVGLRLDLGRLQLLKDCYMQAWSSNSQKQAYLYAAGCFSRSGISRCWSRPSSSDWEMLSASSRRHVRICTMFERGLIVHSTKHVQWLLKDSFRNQVTHPCHARLHCILILLTAGSKDSCGMGLHITAAHHSRTLHAGPARHEL